MSSHHMDIAKTKIWTDTLWPSYVKQGNQDLLVCRKTGPLYYDELKQKIVCVFLITKDEKLRVNQSSMKLWSGFYFCFFFIGFFKFMDYLFTNGYHFELSRKNDYPLTSNRKWVSSFNKLWNESSFSRKCWIDSVNICLMKLCFELKKKCMHR